jgi:hypothetical protein
MLFWIIENGQVILIQPVPDKVVDPKTAKIVMAKAIIEALKECTAK